MRREDRIRLKLFGILLGAVIMIVIVVTQMVRVGDRSKQDTYVTRQDVKALAEALYDPLREKNITDSWGGGEDYLQYGQLEELLSHLEQTEEIAAYLEGHKSRDDVPAGDWYEIYRILLSRYDAEGSIKEDEITVIGTGDGVKDAQGTSLSENGILSANGYVYTYENPTFEDREYEALSVFRKDSLLLSVVSAEKEDITLQNMWVKSVEEQELSIFTKGYEVRFPVEKGVTAAQEQVADLMLREGKIAESKTKTEKCTGRLVKVSGESIEVEGYGELELADGVKVYKLFGKLEENRVGDLIIGYDFTDFVLEDGKVCAALVTRDGAMENIRVLVRNEGFAGYYHESLSLTADTEYKVSWGEESRVLKAGETFTLEAGDNSYGAERISIVPAALTGRISLLSMRREYGNPSYRGTLEIEKRAEGYVAVNELLLEEYLYAVVPSEMPAYYPAEALKAQAVCARTYAYKSMVQAGLGQFGAHVDDSTSYQVYNNIEENAETSAAVRDTKGQVMFYGDIVPGAYYYSTSCGYGSNAAIWSNNNPEDFPYLSARHIASGSQEGVADADAMMEEEAFYQYITKVNENDFEKEEGWYRWTYDLEQLDTGLLRSRMQERMGVNPQLVLVEGTDGSPMETIPELGKVKEISITKRNAGGAAAELVVKGESCTVRVLTEYNLRFVLSDGVTKVNRQDGSQTGPAALLPSAYLVIEPKMEGDAVTGYSCIGGGYGHGVGMSQNAAKNMAEAGYTSDDILTFFYEGIHIEVR